MWNANLDESQDEIKFAMRTVSNLWYADDTILIVESEEKLESPESEREEWKSWLETQHYKTSMISSLITSWQIEGGKVEAVTDLIFLGSKITADSDCSHDIKRYLPLGRKAMENLKSRDITLLTKSV